MQNQNPILFFDGVCGLCNGFVDFVMARDSRKEFRFAPLQGATAAERIPGDVPPTSGPDKNGNMAEFESELLRSFVLMDESGVHRKSDAALRVLQRLGGIWNLARVFRLIPRFIRNRVYDFIARNRYRWFGKREACRMPAPSERQLFLP